MALTTFTEVICHLLGLVFFVYLHDIESKLNIPRYRKVDEYGGRWKFLTMITVDLITIYHAFAVIIDLKSICCRSVKPLDPADRLEMSWASAKGRCEDSDIDQKLKQWRSTFFSSMVFPASFVVCVTFWVLFNISEELILPAEQQKYIPAHGIYNHGIHTAPLVVCILHTSLVSHDSGKAKLSWTVFFSTLYMFWLLWVKHHANFWVYPFFYELSTPLICAFFAGMYSMLMIAFYIGKAMIGLQNKRRSRLAAKLK